jgi:hypothetical protein
MTRLAEAKLILPALKRGASEILLDDLLPI